MRLKIVDFGTDGAQAHDYDPFLDDTPEELLLVEVGQGVTYNDALDDAGWKIGYDEVIDETILNTIDSLIEAEKNDDGDNISHGGKHCYVAIEVFLH